MKLTQNPNKTQYSEENFNLEKFLFDVPLYTKVIISENYMKNLEIKYLFSLDDTFDKKRFNGYNSLKKEVTTFKIEKSLLHNSKIIDKLNFYTTGKVDKSSQPLNFSEFFNIKCLRYDDVFYFSIYWNSEEKYFMKIGQYPSIADLHISKINKEYNKVIDGETLKEFTRAIGLAANGVGIGSFVYLRRIFEKLIWETYSEKKDSLTTTEDNFRKSKMEEKITILKDYLPEFLVEHKILYSILSVGIHELSENECLMYFDVVKSGIEQILDEKVETLNKKRKLENASKDVEELHKKMNSKK
jgi:hypothetical protein